MRPFLAVFGFLLAALFVAVGIKSLLVGESPSFGFFRHGGTIMYITEGWSARVMGLAWCGAAVGTYCLCCLTRAQEGVVGRIGRRLGWLTFAIGFAVVAAVEFVRLLVPGAL